MRLRLGAAATGADVPCAPSPAGAVRLGLTGKQLFKAFCNSDTCFRVAFRSSASQGKGCSAVGATPSASLRLASCASMAERAAAYQLCNLADTGRLTTNSSLPTLACSAFSSQAFREDSACAKDPSVSRNWHVPVFFFLLATFGVLLASFPFLLQHFALHSLICL